MKSAILTLLVALISAAWPSSAPAANAEAQRIDLAHASWTRNGVQPEVRPVVLEAGMRPPGVVSKPGEVPPAPQVLLPFDSVGVRWAHVFVTEQAAMMRMELEWRPGPAGALFEVILNGRRLSPARDGWRPTERGVRTDLGAMWLGRGKHLLEFVSRETAEAAELRLSVLRLRTVTGQ